MYNAVMGEAPHRNPDRSVRDLRGDAHNDWIAQAAEAVDTLKGTARMAKSFGLSTDAPPNHPTPFRIESAVINGTQRSYLLTDGIEPFEDYFKKGGKQSIERKYPSGKVIRGIQHNPCEVIVVDSTQAIGAPEGLRLRASAEREIDNIGFSFYEDETFELAIRDKKPDPAGELAFSSGRRALDEMSTYEWDVALAILNQVWFDIKIEEINEMIRQQDREFAKQVQATQAKPRPGIVAQKKVIEGASQNDVDPQNHQ